jgi:hypothetical protein
MFEGGSIMNNFICPECKGHLLVGENIIFKVKNSKKHSGLFLLSPQIGNYNSHKHRLFEIKSGEVLEFFCPICNGSLKSDIDKNLAHVILIDESDQSHDVYFSQIVDEHSTFETNGDALHIEGEDAGKYTYFKIGEKFRKYF